MAVDSRATYGSEPRTSKKNGSNTDDIVPTSRTDNIEGKAREPAPKLEAVMSSDRKMRAMADELKSTKLGAIAGTFLFQITLPFYAINRVVHGMNREDSMNEAFKTAWNLIAVILTFAPVPETPIIRGIGAMMSLTAIPVNKLSDKELDQFAAFAVDVGKDEEVKQALQQAGFVVALTAASGQEINDETLMTIGKDIAKTGGRVAERKAIEQGHMTARDTAQIKRAVTQASEVKT